MRARPQAASRCRGTRQRGDLHGGATFPGSKDTRAQRQTNFNIAATSSPTTSVSSLNPSLFNQPVTFTATVSRRPARGPADRHGDVLQWNDKLGTGKLSVGSRRTPRRTRPQPSIPARTRSRRLTAATRSPRPEHLGPGQPGGVPRQHAEVALSVANTTPVVGQPVTFTATVTVLSPGTVTPTGR